MTDIAIPLSSRYKDSFAHEDTAGVPVLGPMQLPEEFLTTSPAWTVHTVSEHEVGFLDKLAHRYFGMGQEHLWWVIALVNGIVDADLDVQPGQRLMIPPRDLVSRFAERRTRA